MLVFLVSTLRSRWARLAAVAIAGLLTGSAATATPLDPVRFIAVDEIEAGMQGTGLTTFGEAGVTEFQVEVIGVLRGWVPGGDLIIIEAAGGPLAETGIYQGMSGSPVYLDGRLAGAVAYNLGGFGERAIGGVTPIAEMLPILDETAAAGSGGSIDPRLRGAAEASGGVRSASLGPQNGIVPIGTPVALSGFHPAAQQVLGGWFDDLGMTAAVGGQAAATDAGAPIEPGGPIGVQMVRGDVQATAMGTVTYVDGDRVLAFGHPMFHAGNIDLPMTTARVFTVYPSQAISFVIGAAAQPVGRIVADRQAGIAGEMGGEAPMVPLAIDIVRPDGSERSFSFEVIRNKFFLTQFVGFLAYNSLLADQESFGDATVDMQMAVSFADGTELEFDDVFATTTAPGALAQRASGPLGGILLSGIERVTVERVALRLELSPEVRQATIEEVVVDETEVEAGDVVRATVHLRRHEAGRQTVTVDVPIPAGTHAGPLLLRACSAEFDTEWERRRAPRRQMPESLEQYVELYEEHSGASRLRLTLHADAQGVVVQGREMMGLPSSIFRVMDSAKRTGGRSGSWGRLIYRQLVETDLELNGCQQLRIDVKEPARATAPRPQLWQ